MQAVKCLLCLVMHFTFVDLSYLQDLCNNHSGIGFLLLFSSLDYWKSLFAALTSSYFKYF